MIVALASFISLSFIKNNSVVYAIISPGQVKENHTNYYLISLLNVDANYSSKLDHFKRPSTHFFIPLIIVSILTNSLTILLLLYPFKCFRKLLSYCGPKKYHAIYVFIDTFQGHYKDGTNGTRDYRVASYISFLLRIIACYIINIQAVSKEGNPIEHYVPFIFILTLTSLFYAIVQPCKVKYMNISESLLYSLAGMILMFLGSIHFKSNKSSHVLATNIALFLVALPSLIVIGTFIAKIINCLSCVRNPLLILQAAPHADLLPDRMINPSDYEPIV